MAVAPIRVLRLRGAPMTTLAAAVEGMAHWDWCPFCRGGLDTGLECEKCGADLMPIQKALYQRAGSPIAASVLSRIRARADRCRLGYGGKAWVTSDPKSEVVEDRMWLLEFIDRQSREMNQLRESLQYAADSFRNLGCAVDADDCEEAIKESLSGGVPGEPDACRTAQERGIAAATGAGQHPADNPESAGDSAERRSPVGTRGTPTPDESNRPEIVTMSERNVTPINRSNAALIQSRAKSSGAGRRLIGGEWIFNDDDLARFHDYMIAIGMAEAAIICEGEAEDFKRYGKGDTSALYIHKADTAMDLATQIRAAAPKVAP